MNRYIVLKRGQYPCSPPCQSLHFPKIILREKRMGNLQLCWCIMVTANPPISGTGGQNITKPNQFLKT
ncbi:hypothetical protein GDO81_003298 [Engystomops pustulosus]|uniref:Uncharacterized protein n=1 Tax=Engystomops pustulosus TaxID=76066 RepID=A0AAV6ZVY4_ENGPU|nr:hypothetical protein GDO81_003298 [Engystomops pustulosus]